VARRGLRDFLAHPLPSLFYGTCFAAINVPAMIVWGVTIVVLTGLGFALAFVGLAVAVPVIGHATWHAYRALVE
jgi:uncharacterized membrane protein